MSMWSVPDKETKELMVEFYRNITSAGMNRCQALRQAALKEMKIIKERYGHTNPFFWGGFVFLGEPGLLSGANRYHHYIHVASFRAKRKADQLARRLRNKGYNTIAKGEEVANRGYWYRVYVGPFSSLQEAELKSRELKTKRLVGYTAIQKEGFLLGK